MLASQRAIRQAAGACHPVPLRCPDQTFSSPARHTEFKCRY